jgi:hypothetical protein
MKKFLCSLPGLAIMMALSGCCANDVCLCNDRLADALAFRYAHAIKVATGINASSVDSVIVARTTLPDPKNPTSTTRTDSLVVGRRVFVPTAGSTTAIVTQDTVIINNASPFASAGSTTKLDAYTYRITLYKSAKALATYRITHVELQGRYNSTGCCTCYQNLSKVLTLGTKRDTVRFAVTDSVQNKLRAVLLRR